MNVGRIITNKFEGVAILGKEKATLSRAIDEAVSVEVSRVQTVERDLSDDRVLLEALEKSRVRQQERLRTQKLARALMELGATVDAIPGELRRGDIEWYLDRLGEMIKVAMKSYDPPQNETIGDARLKESKA